MTANVEQFAVGVAEYFFWAVKNGAYPYGATGALSNGSDSGMQRHKGLASAALTFPQVPRTAILGDGGKLGEFLGQVVDTTDASVTFNVFDLNFDTALDGRNIYADGEHDAVIFSTNCASYADLCAVYNVQAQSFASGSTGEGGWAVFELFDFEAAPNMPSLSGTSFEAQAVQYQISLYEVDTELSGLTISDTNYGVSKGTVKMYWSENPVCFHTHIGDGSDTTVTLDYTPAAADGDNIQLWQDGVAKTYTTDYTASGTTFTFDSAPSAGVVSVIRYQFQSGC